MEQKTELESLRAEVAHLRNAHEALRAALDDALGFVIAATAAGQLGHGANTLPPPYVLQTKIRAALAAAKGE